MTILRIKKRYKAYAHESRAVTALLGFNGTQGLASFAAISLDTAVSLMGLGKTNRHQHHVILQFHEALHSRYMSQRRHLGPGARAFLKEWARSWKKIALNHLLYTEARTRAEVDTPGRFRDRQRRQVRMRRTVALGLNALKWV